jgi:hypothetical protein
MAVARVSAVAQGEPTAQLPMRGPVCAEASTDQSAVKRQTGGRHEIQAAPNRQFWENPLSPAAFELRPPVPDAQSRNRRDAPRSEIVTLGRGGPRVQQRGQHPTLRVDFGPCHAVASGKHLHRRAGPTEYDFFSVHGLCV